MARTDEQVMADEAMTKAIERVRDAYFGDEARSVTMEYATVVAVTELDEDGDPITGTLLLYRDGHIPTHRAMGLFYSALKKLEG